MTCVYDDEFVIDGQAILPNLVGNNPSFSIPNPGTYEITFISTNPCIDPPVDFSHIITVIGFPIIDETSFDSNQSCDFSTNLSLDFDTCNAKPPYISSWDV